MRAATATEARVARRAGDQEVRRGTGTAPLAWRPQPRLLVVRPGGRPHDQLGIFAHYLAHLLHGRLTWFDMSQAARRPDLGALADATAGHEVVLLGDDDQPLLRRMVDGPLACQLLEQTSASVLVAHAPLWPIRRILAVTQGRDVDDAAVAWAARIAEPSGASITLLVVLPELPTAGQACMQGVGPAQWRGSGTALGHQVELLDQLIPGWTWTGAMRWRSGTAFGQVRRELAEGRPDLVVVSADDGDWFSRRVTGCLARGLVGESVRPVLVARP